MSLNMEDTLLSADEGKKAHRICAQLLYCVTTVYLNAQWCIYYIARYTSHPTKLYKECLLHALRHLFGTRHIGLTLGGVGDGQLQSTGRRTRWRQVMNSTRREPIRTQDMRSQDRRLEGTRKTWETRRSTATADSTTSRHSARRMLKVTSCRVQWHRSWGLVSLRAR